MSTNGENFGITTAGFITKPAETILQEKIEAAKRIFGEDIDLSSTSPVMQLLEVGVLEEFDLWQKFEELFFSQFVSTATVSALDDLAFELGIERKKSIKATVSLALRTSSIKDVVVPAGALFSTPGGIQFQLTVNATLTSGKLTDDNGADNLTSLKHIGLLTRTTVRDFLPSPFDLNSSLTVITVSDNQIIDAAEYPSVGNTYIYSTIGAHNNLFSFGYNENVQFNAKTAFIAKANLTWNDPARTEDGFIRFDSSASSFIDHTSPASSVPIFGAATAATKLNDVTYFGSTRKFSRLIFNTISNEFASAATIKVEFRNSQTLPNFDDSGNWTEIGGINDATTGFSVSGTAIMVLSFLQSEWNNWTADVPNVTGVTLAENLFFVRITILSATSTDITAASIDYDNGIIPTPGTTYFIGVSGNQWDNGTVEALIGGTIGNVLSESITIINTSVQGLAGTINQLAATGGIDRENDASFSARMIDFPRTFWSAGIVRARVTGITGINSAIIEESNITREAVITSTFLNPTFAARFEDDSANVVVNFDNAAINDTIDDVKVHEDTLDMLAIGSELKFSRIRVTITTAHVGAGSLQVKFWDGTAMTAISNVQDDSAGMASTGVFDIILKMTDVEYNDWTATGIDDVLVDGTPGGTNRFYITLDFSVAPATTDPLLGKIEVFNESINLGRQAFNPGAHNGVKRISILDVSSGLTTNLIDEINATFPDIKLDSEYWTDYNVPSTVLFFKDILGAGDIVRADFQDGAIGQNFIRATILPDAPPLSSQLRGEVSDVLLENIPVGTSFEIVEAAFVAFDISGVLKFDTVDFDINAINTAIFDQLTVSYFSLLNLDEDVIRNRVIQEIMSVGGIEDITSLIFNISLELFTTGATDPVEIEGAKIFAFVGPSDFGTTMLLDTNGDGDFIETAVENSGTPAEKYTIISPSGVSNGKIDFDAAVGITSNTQFKFTYFSTEGNVKIAERFVARLSSVKFTSG